jgi:TonB family protein
VVNNGSNPRALPDGAGGSPGSSITPIPQEQSTERLVVLSDDASLVTALERIGAPHEVIAVSKEAELARTLRESPAAVAVIDSAMVNRTPLDRLTARLKLQFPQLILIVAGDPADQAVLADQLAGGRIYRFLQKPIPPQRLKHFIDGAWLRHEESAGELVAAPQPPDLIGGGRKALIRGLIAAGVIVVVAGGAYMVRKFVMAPEPAPSASAPALSAESALGDLLTHADAALAAGGYENAADLYRKAQQIAPGDPRVKEGISQVVRRVLSAAQTQLLDRHIERAQALAKVANELESDNPAVQQLVNLISNAQDHGGAVSAPPATAPAARPGAEVREVIRARLDDNLRHAQELMRQGHLIDPAQDNARVSLAKARELAPNDPKVRQLQRALLDQILAEGRKALAAGRPEDTERLVAPAQELGARPEELAALQGKGASGRGEALDRATSLFNERLNQGKILDPAADSAKFYLSQLVKFDPNSPATQIARMALGQRLIAEAQSAVRHQDFSNAKRWLQEARDAGVDGTQVANVEADLAAAQAPAAAPKALVEKPTLVKTHDVEPVYPNAAASMRLKGNVSVQFTVRQDGTTAEFAVVSATPTGIFEQAAIDAVRKWKYRPPLLKDGTPTQVRAEVKLNFAP